MTADILLLMTDSLVSQLALAPVPVNDSFHFKEG